MTGDDFTLDDFKGQLRQVLQPGLLMRMVSMLPGMGGVKEMLNDHTAEAEMRRMLGIIDSMTSVERDEPRLIDRSRCERIACGSGVQAEDVKFLLKQFNMMAPVMNAMAGKGMGQRMQAIEELRRNDGRFGL